MSELDRIRWHCRRGMLELDLILSAFLDRHLDRLDPGELDALRDLLEQPDNDLLALVMGHARAPDPRCAALLELMRARP